MSQSGWKLARDFLRLIWTPKTGDQVLIETASGRFKTHVTHTEPGSAWTEKFPDREFHSTELQYRPTLARYREILEGFASLNPSGEWVFRSGKLLLVERARPPRLLAKILAYRFIDSALNTRVNQLVFSSRGHLPLGQICLMSPPDPMLR